MFNNFLVARFLVFVFAAVMLLTGCSSEPEKYTSVNRNGFMSSCTQTAGDVETEAFESEQDRQEKLSEVDDPLITSLCQCVLEETEKSVQIEEFIELDAKLVEDPDLDLPTDVKQTIADCLIETAELQSS